MMSAETKSSQRPAVDWRILFFCAFGGLVGVAILFFATREPHGSSADESSPASGSLSVPSDSPAGKDETMVPAQREEAPPEKKDEVYRVSVSLTASFYTTFSENPSIAQVAQETGIGNLAERLSAHVARNLMWLVDMRREVYPGDTLDFLFRVVPPNERINRPDLPDEVELLALSYQSVKLGREVRFYQFQASNWPFPAFYYVDGRRVEKMMKNPPIKAWIQITSLLRDRRPRHDGLDFKAPIGTPVYAPWGGVVERVNWNVRYNGKSLLARLDTNPPVWMILLHLDKVLLKPGQRFAAGDHIANVGNTGRSFAPHLHYQLQYDGPKSRRIIDPLQYHGTEERRLLPQDETAFRTKVMAYDAIFNAEAQ